MKQMSIFILFIVVFITTYSCQSSKMNYAGDYLKRKDLSLFILNKDSTFEYKERYSRKYSVGKWTIIGKKIILNSYIQKKLALMDVKVTPSNGKLTEVNVNLNVSGLDNKNYICYPILNENVFYTISPSKYRGSYSASFEMDINNISFQIEKCPLALEVIGIRQPEYYKVYSNSHKLQDKKGDIIDVNLTVPDSLFSYRIFTDVKMKIKGDAIYLKDLERKKKYKFIRPRSRKDEKNIEYIKEYKIHRR